MAQMCPAKSTIVPFKKQMYSSGSIILSYIDDKCICVSIHAPTRGATHFAPSSDRRTRSFNPRTHEGCDVELPALGLDSSVFQSTHPRGVRHILIYYIVCYDGFNPRTHEGCDQGRGGTTGSRGVSIHAPTRGATVELPALALILRCFNPRTHEGCDKRERRAAQTRTVSIHAPTRGATEKRGLQQNVPDVSIHAPTRGATDLVKDDEPAQQVSIHAPTRGATYKGYSANSWYRCFNPRTHEGCDKDSSP